jgi:hypothetical protein
VSGASAASRRRRLYFLKYRKKTCTSLQLVSLGADAWNSKTKTPRRRTTTRKSGKHRLTPRPAASCRPGPVTGGSWDDSKCSSGCRCCARTTCATARGGCFGTRCHPQVQTDWLTCAGWSCGSRGPRCWRAPGRCTSMCPHKRWISMDTLIIINYTSKYFVGSGVWIS